MACDDIGKKNYEGEIERTNQLLSPPPPIFNDDQEQVRYINIRKSETEPLVCQLKRLIIISLINKSFLVDKICNN